VPVAPSVVPVVPVPVVLVVPVPVVPSVVPVVPVPVPVVPAPLPAAPDWAEAGTAKETVAKPKVQALAKTTFNNLEDFMVMLAFT